MIAGIGELVEGTLQVNGCPAPCESAGSNMEPSLVVFSGGTAFNSIAGELSLPKFSFETLQEVNISSSASQSYRHFHCEASMHCKYASPCRVCIFIARGLLVDTRIIVALGRQPAEGNYQSGTCLASIR